MPANHYSLLSSNQSCRKLAAQNREANRPVIAVQCCFTVGPDLLIVRFTEDLPSLLCSCSCVFHKAAHLLATEETTSRGKLSIWQFYHCSGLTHRFMYAHVYATAHDKQCAIFLCSGLNKCVLDKCVLLYICDHIFRTFTVFVHYTSYVN